MNISSVLLLQRSNCLVGRNKIALGKGKRAKTESSRHSAKYYELRSYPWMCLISDSCHASDLKHILGWEISSSLHQRFLLTAAAPWGKISDPLEAPLWAWLQAGREFWKTKMNLNSASLGSSGSQSDGTKWSLPGPSLFFSVSVSVCLCWESISNMCCSCWCSLKFEETKNVPSFTLKCGWGGGEATEWFPLTKVQARL